MIQSFYRYRVRKLRRTGKDMQTPTITTIVRMIEAMPEPAQNQILEHLREYISDLQDEDSWDELVQKTKPKLGEAARLARKQIEQGLSIPMDQSRL
jgi:hypothetical protein